MNNVSKSLAAMMRDSGLSYDDFKKKKKREMKELLSDAGYDVKGMETEEMLNLFEDEYELPFH